MTSYIHSVLRKAQIYLICCEKKQELYYVASILLHTKAICRYKYTVLLCAKCSKKITKHSHQLRIWSTISRIGQMVGFDTLLPLIQGQNFYGICIYFHKFNVFVFALNLIMSDVALKTMPSTICKVSRARFSLHVYTE